MDPLISASLASRIASRRAEADAWRLRADRPRRRRRHHVPSATTAEVRP